MCINSEFKEICLKLATNGRSDKGFLLTSKVCPQGVFCPWPRAIYMYQIIKNVYCLPLPGAIYIMVKHEKKMYIKSDFKAFFLNLQQMGEVIRAFC